MYLFKILIQTQLYIKHIYISLVDMKLKAKYINDVRYK